MIGRRSVRRLGLPPWRSLVLTGGLLLGALGSRGDPGDVSLETWLSAALERDPDLAEARAERDWQTARTGAQPVWEDPELRLGTEQREDRGDQTTVRLRLPVPNPWAVRAGLARAEARAAGESARLEAVRWERRIELASLYFEAVYARELLVRRTALLVGLEADLEDAERGAQAGALSRPRLLELRGNRALLAARVTGDEVAWSNLLEELRTRAGWSENAVARLTTELPRPETLPELPTVEHLRALAFRERGALEALAAEQREGEALEAEARARSLPWITFLEGSWARDADRGRDDFEARIAVNLPIFSQLRRSQTEEAIRLLRTRDRLRSVATALEAALQAARHRAEMASARLRTVHQTTAASLLEIEPALAAAGIDPPDRSDLRDLVYDLQRERLQAARDCQRALLDLMVLAGPGLGDPGQPF